MKKKRCFLLPFYVVIVERSGILHPVCSYFQCSLQMFKLCLR